ncbi:MAG: glycosyltransferase family 4 protein [Candidatus Paceibacterota bacterium]
MILLSIGTERRIFDIESEAHSRIFSYSKLFDEMYVIVFNTKKNLNINFNQKKFGEKLFVYPTNSINRWFYVLDAIKIGLRIIKEKKLNKNNSYITAQDPFETGLVGWFLSFRSKIKLNIQIHTDIFSSYFKKGHILNLLRIPISNFVIPKADSIRVVSESIKNLIIKKFNVDKNKITILPIVVDEQKIINSEITTDLHKKYSQFDFIFLIISRLEKEKNIPTIIESFKEALKQNPKTGLIIIGDGNCKKLLEEFVKKHNLQKNIIFEGWSNNIHTYLKTADAFVSSSFYEGYGMVFIEAVLCNCPIISSNVGIIKEGFKDEENAMICNADDKECFSKKMTKIVNNNILRNKLIKNATKVLENNNIILNSDKYLVNYKKLFEL